MSRAATTRTVGDQITTLLAGFTLTTAAREMVSRFVQADQQPALPLLLDVLLLEAQERHERRITRLRRASKLPPGKTFDTLDEGRLPPTLVRRLHELADGDFLDDATNVLAFGLPGVGKAASNRSPERTVPLAQENERDRVSETIREIVFNGLDGLPLR